LFDQPPKPNLPRWTKGGQPSHGKLNGPVDWINAFVQSQGMGKPGAPAPSLTVAYLGLTVATGPNSEGDFADARYWVQDAFVSAASSAASAAIQIVEDYAKAANLPTDTPTAEQRQLYIREVTNLAEWYSDSGGGHALPPGSPVIVFALRDQGGSADPAQNPTGGTVRYVMMVPVPPGVFPVSLTQTGGANATDATTKASWTYTVNAEPDGRTLGTGVAPIHQRAFGKTTAATRGMAYYDGASLMLLWTDEVIGAGAC
jgi:hypothetical protein